MGRFPHHDSGINWLDWRLLNSNAGLLRFVRSCIAFRKAHPVLRNDGYLCNEDYVGSGYADITWHGARAWAPDRSEGSRTLAFMLCGKHAQGGRDVDDYIEPGDEPLLRDQERFAVSGRSVVILVGKWNV